MITLDEPFEPDIKYLDKLWKSQGNSIKNNGMYKDTLYQKD